MFGHDLEFCGFAVNLARTTKGGAIEATTVHRPSPQRRMKAIKCTQCGAKIENVSESSLIINCDYCGARIMLNSRPLEMKQSFTIAPAELGDRSGFRPPIKLIVFVAAVIFLVPFLVIIAALVYGPDESSRPNPDSAVANGIDQGQPAESSQPRPSVNYQPRLSWDGPNDLQYFASPEVNVSSVSHLSTEEIRETVFKDRIVKLRVLINTEGEIDNVETVSGHPILVDAATASAKATIFKPRSKPTTRVLTYTFRVIAD
jgi:DNA-directed RNA polymerase subunit RPC12/RpoP